MVLIRKLSKPDSQPYIRPNDDSYLVPVVAEQTGESEVLVKRSSIRRLRKQYTWAVTAFTVGSLLILFQSPARNDFLAPGPLASSHGQILNGLGAERCNACHTVGNQSFMQWAVSSLQPGRNIQACQSDLCMKCHHATMDNELATLPHNVQPFVLASMNKDFVSTAAGEASVDAVGGNMECSICHKEHHGNRDLTLLTDQQCQTCHQQQFDSFEGGHPEFTSWPQSRRQSIAFDHVSHGFKHFGASKTEFDCKMCHLDGAYSNVKRLAPYEQSCAQCHEKDILNRNESGVQIVGLPSLDLDAIDDLGLNVGVWPENANGDFDGEIPELMQMLLSCDSEFLEIAERRAGAIAFSDFDPESKTDIEDAVKIVWSIKRLFYELATQGTDALTQKYAQSTGVSADDPRLYLLTRGLDANVFANAANRWFPGIAEEVPRHLQNPRNKESVSITPAFESVLPNTELKLEPSDMTLLVENEPVLNYIPSLPIQDQDVLIPNPLKELMAGKTSAPASPVQSVHNQGRGQAQLAQQSANQAVQGSRQTVPVAQIPDSELLAANPLQGKSLSTPAASVQVPVGNSLQANNEPVQEAPIQQGAPDPSQVVKEFSQEIEHLKQRRNRHQEQAQGGFEVQDRHENGEVFVGSTRGSGWFRNDDLYQISYRPTKHADEFLTTMMELVASVPNAKNNPASAAYFRKMVSKSSVGACNDCHTVDSNRSDFRVNWIASYRDPAIGAFTQFSHGPHLIQKELADCKACHELSAELSNAHTFASFDSSVSISNFKPIHKANCVSCHHATGAGNSCSQCHDYHVGAKKLLSE